MSEMPDTIYATKYPYCEYRDEKKQAEYIDQMNFADGVTDYTRSDLCVPRADVMKLVEVLDLIANGRKIDDDTWEVIDQEDMELFARDALAEFQRKHGGA